ncbi:MAG: hypothetical protein O7D34_12755 [Ignavibacteria bacterium]|nr:hypothetical protein [Ignavibacteria bacterium]
MAAFRIAVVISFSLFCLTCNLFETREPEEPSQTSFNYVPATVPSIVLSNLQNAIAQKSIENYISNFSDSAVTNRRFTFMGSPEASVQYPNIRSWSYTDEREYFQNLIANAIANGFSSLLLTATDSSITADEANYDFDYIFTFEHTDPGFPTNTARGHLQFIMATDQSGIWTIYQWSDSKTTEDITWSSFKGKFGN